MFPSFKNDYSALCHPKILNALSNCLDEVNIPYGLDSHSKNAETIIKRTFSLKDADIHFLSGGTQTNLVLISHVLKDSEAVISLESGHIVAHECGAIESTGHKIITVKGKEGKMYPSDIISVMEKHTNEHTVKPKLIYISNSTEIGTIYSKQELLDLRKIADYYDLYIFLDGARLGSALTSKYNDVDPSLLGRVCDAFYIGGTKNGLLFGEALVIINKALTNSFRYHLKNKGAMLAKGFVAGIMFEELFKDGLFFDIAQYTNEVADYLKENLKKMGLLQEIQPTNQVFVSFDNNIAEDIICKFQTEMWDRNDDQTILRFVVSFNITKQDVNILIDYLQKTLR